jgi:hypothetical protein
MFVFLGFGVKGRGRVSLRLRAAVEYPRLEVSEMECSKRTSWGTLPYLILQFSGTRLVDFDFTPATYQHY